MLNNENYGYLVHPLSQFMDDNLKPLTSAYLKVFYAGTSSSAYTYSDWEGTLNPSNIMLSMNGSANVIAEKNKAYKVMLCDALHPPSNPIWVKDNLYVIGSEIGVISSTQIKDNARDDVTDPIHPDNITDIEQLTLVRNVGADANYTMVESEERTYGVLIPAPSMEADSGKVPIYKTGNQIVWENPPTQGLVPLTITPVIVDTTATLTIEQGGFASIDLTSETTLTAVSVVLTNTSGVVMPVWWFKIKAGSDVTLSVKIGATAVGWLGSAITNIELGKTIEVSVVDGVACGGELV